MRFLYGFLLVVLILDSLILIGAVLLQSGKGGGLAASFGGASSSTDSLIGTRQAGNLLTKLSWWCGGIFLALAFVLQLMSTRSRVPSSVLDRSFSTPPVAPAAPGAGSAIPLEPVTPAPGTPPPGTPAPGAPPAGGATPTPPATKQP